MHYSSQGQQYTLEQVDLTPTGATSSVNTYMTGINNRAYSCGYYTDSMGNNIGFVITRKGVVLIVDQSLTGSNNNKIVSINDHDIALVSSTSGGQTTLWKMYCVDEDIANFVQVNGVVQNNANALKINNNNDISGWYQGVNSRWLFVLHDSIVPPGQPVWDASRLMVGATYYNTWGASSDSANYVAGFYLDAPNYYPFICDLTNNTYQTLTAPSKTKVWGMNGAHTLVGEYQQPNGYYMAFFGDVTGNTLNLTSLAYIFQSNTIQSVANDISESGMIVGSFVDPVSNVWKGFIYRPGQDEYRYNGWDFQKHSFAMTNTDEPGALNPFWNHNYFDQYIDYMQFDNYLFDGDPLIDDCIKAKYKKNTYSKYLFPDWKSFAIEADKNFTPNGTALDKLKYKYFKKYSLFDKYKHYYGNFEGACYGFAVLSMMKYAKENSILQKFNMPYFPNFDTYTNFDSVAKTSVTRAFLHQFDKDLKMKEMDPYYYYYPQWLGSYRTKSYMSDPQQYVDYRTLSFETVNNGKIGLHSVFPYAIKTPKKLPFTYNGIFSMDTIMIYDSNFPLDSNQYIAIYVNDLFYTTGSWSSNYYIEGMLFNDPTYTELMNTTFAQLKPTRSNDTIYSFSLSDKSNYSILFNGKTCSLVDTIYSNDIPDLLDLINKDASSFYPLYFKTDTANLMNIQQSKYSDSVMSITQTIDDISMGISRNALPTEYDNFSIKNNYIAYGNPENTPKNITCFFVQTSNASAQALNLVASNITLSANDSLITKNPYNYAYQIIHPTASTNVKYDLDLYVLYTDSVKRFQANTLPLDPNTSHIIDPYYSGVNGLQTVIFVDNGINGTDDDTLFIPQVALSVDHFDKNIKEVKIFPNPAGERFNIQATVDNAENYDIIICNLEGKIVQKESVHFEKNSNSKSIQISSLSTGVYIVFMFDKNKNMVYKEKLIRK